MAASAVASQSPTNTAAPSSPDRHSKEIPRPLSLTVDTPAASSPFPSPSSSFVPPPMPGAHEFANKPPPSGRFVRRKKSGEPGSPASNKKAEAPIKEPNGTMPMLDTDMRAMGSSAVGTPITPTPASLAMTPTSMSPPDAIPATNATLDTGRNTPTQMHITLPSPPSSPSLMSHNSFTPMRTPSGSGTASKHTSLSSSRPAPASPSPAPSRRQSGAPSLRSRHRSGLSTTSTSSKYGTIKSPPSLMQPAKRKGEIKIRDFAFPGVDLRHKGRGPDAPKVIKRLLKQHGPVLEADSRRASGMSESSVDSDEGSSRRSSGFGSWGAFRWASKIGGGWGFGSGSAGRTSGSGASGFTPSQQDFERNFDDEVDPDPSDSAADASEGDYLSDYDNDNDGDGDGDGEELLPGLYRALYDFDPEGTAEMGLREGQMVKVVGRGGGVGWAIVIRPDAGPEDAGGEGSWALVPESYLRLVRLDEVEQEADEGPSLDEREEEPVG